MFDKPLEEDLLNAAGSGDLPRVRSLLEKKQADVNVQNKEGSTPLMRVATFGHLAILQ